jgi:hypothetical protein
MSLGREIHPYWGGGVPGDSAVVNFRSNPLHDIAAYAAGYQRQARTLVDHLEAVDDFPDFDAYPVFFLYRHALELYLKAIVIRGADYLGLIANRDLDLRTVFRSHELVYLLPAVREVFGVVGWKDGFGLPNVDSWADLLCLLEAIEKVDRKGYAFRFPTNNQGNAALPYDHLILGPITFGKHMDLVLEFLGSAYVNLEEKRCNAAEAMHFLEELLDEWRRES